MTVKERDRCIVCGGRVIADFMRTCPSCIRDGRRLVTSPAEADAQEGAEKHRDQNEASAETETTKDLNACIVHNKHSTPKLAVEEIRDFMRKAGPGYYGNEADEHIAFLLAEVERVKSDYVTSACLECGMVTDKRITCADCLRERDNDELAAARKRIAELETCRVCELHWPGCKQWACEGCQ